MTTSANQAPSPGPLGDSRTRGGPVTGRRALLGAGLAAGALGLLAACSDEKVQRVAPQPVRADDPSTQVPKTPTPTDAAEIFTGSFESAQMLGRETNWMVARPAGVTGELPVVVVLHALNTDHRAAFMGGLEMQSLMQDWATEGNAPFALASVDADRSYYHPRTDGTDGGAMVLDEFLPLLEGNPELGLRTDRIGFFGWSMGGYGALRLGAMLGAPRVAAIAVSSPALWGDPANFPPRAFDTLADYQANSLFGQQDSFTQIPLLIECGSSDQFFTYTRQWMAGLRPPPAFGTSPGGHTNRYWRGVLPEQIAFLGRSLAD
ncbi:alpha/beta hydrolase family protein [Nocardia sp. 348MFTsu5.1]|uniref:alpha/beta hydrolase n=1 Tax=Nocardia sp. 348MFTsu5.1 TaxID=1172185 RepID=UPI00048CC9D9|nr:esterase [Nocardia sp. 348MFTsu5.1]